MKSVIALVFALVLAVGAPKKAEASDIATSVVVGVVVTHYAGVGVGIAASMVLAGAAVLIHSSGKEAVAQAALNDIADYNLNGQLSLALENTINGIKAELGDMSDEEAMDLIVSSL